MLGKVEDFNGQVMGIVAGADCGVGSIVWTGYPVGPTPRWVFRYC
jgi:hypothetical protein